MTDSADNNPDRFVPEPFRRRGLWGSLLFSGVLIVYYIAFIVGLVTASPRDLGLSNLLLFSLLCFVFFATPWDQLGRALRRFGPVEFERKLEGQSEERVREISALEDRIAALEAGHSLAAVRAAVPKAESEVQKLLISYFREHDQQAVSPRALASWAARQDGYETLADSPDRLRRALRHLVVSGVLETRVGDEGQTLYRIRT